MVRIMKIVFSIPNVVTNYLDLQRYIFLFSDNTTSISKKKFQIEWICLIQFHTARSKITNKLNILYVLLSS